MNLSFNQSLFTLANTITNLQTLKPKQSNNLN